MRVAIRDWEVDLHWPRKVPSEVFVRFGMWSASYNQSMNHATGEFEQGLSVYPATIDAALTVRLDDDVDVYPECEDRFAFPVTGRVVGTGSDGEPLLKGVRVLPYPLAVETRRRVLRDLTEPQWKQAEKIRQISR